MNSIRPLRLGALIMAAVLALGAMPVIGVSDAGYTYTAYADKIHINGFDPSATEIIIPEAINELPVLSMDYSAFSGSAASVFLPDSLQYFDCRTFLTNDFLKSTDGDFTIIGANILYHYNGDGGDVVIPDYVTRISAEAFCGCTGLTSVTLHEGITRIERSAFEDCSSLTSIVLPQSLNYLGDSAFYRCTALESLSVPSTLSAIGEEAFGQTPWAEKYGIVNSTDYMQIGADILYSYLGSDSKVDLSGLSAIGSAAFSYNQALSSVTISDGASSIGNCAFYGCSELKSALIPKSVTSIGHAAFFGCDELVIYGYSDSFAQSYAAENTIPFIALDSELLLGDVDCDSVVTAADSLAILQYLSYMCELNERQLEAADVDGDRNVTAYDALAILKYVSYIIVDF